MKAISQNHMGWLTSIYTNLCLHEHFLLPKEAQFCSKLTLIFVFSHGCEMVKHSNPSRWVVMHISDYLKICYHNILFN